MRSFLKFSVKKIWIWLNRLHWLWLLFAAPFLLFPNPKRSLALLVVPAVWLLSWFVSRQSPVSHSSTFNLQPSAFPITPLNSAILVIALMVLVSTWATYDIAFSLPKISGMVLGLGIFFAIVRESERPRGWWLALMLFLGAGVGIAGLGLFGVSWFTSKLGAYLDVVTGRLPTLISGLPGAEGGFHPNEIAGALTWVLPVLIALCLSPSPTGRGGRGPVLSKAEGVRVVIWLSTLFVAGVFVLTQSRSGYIGVAIASIVMLFIALPARWRWALLGLMLLTGLVLALTLSPEDFANLREWVVGEGLTTERALSLNTLESRMEIWSRAIYGLQDFPFTGMGMNTFREVVHVLYPLFLIAPDRDFGHAHNEFLQAGLDLGIPGMIAFIALYIGSFWMALKIWNYPPVGAQPSTLNLQRVTALGLGGGLFAHLLYGLTDAVALGAKPGFLFWMLLGLIAGLYQRIFKSVPVIQSNVDEYAKTGISNA